MAEYRDKLEEFSVPLENLDNDTLERKFVDGLKEDIKIKLRVNRPVGLNLIIETTQKLKDELLHFEEKYSRATFNPKASVQSPSSLSGSSKSICMVLNPTRELSL